MASDRKSGVNVRNPGPPWLWLFGDIWFAVVMIPAIASAYLIARGRLAPGGALLAAWSAAIVVIASAIDSRGYARRWIILTGGVCVFAVSLLVFNWLPTL